MANKRRVSDQAIQLALQNSLGFRSMAAHTLGISPATLRRRLKENPQLASTAAALNMRQDALVKAAVGKLALQGDLKAIICWLTTYCGWIARSARRRKLLGRLPTIRTRQLALSQATALQRSLGLVNKSLRLGRSEKAVPEVKQLAQLAAHPANEKPSSSTACSKPRPQTDLLESSGQVFWLRHQQHVRIGVMLKLD